MMLAQIHTSEKGDELLFKDSKSHITLVEDDGTRLEKLSPWRILIVDDDEIVHQVSMMVLSDFTYKNRGLEILHAYSAKEAMVLMEKEKDVSVILLDVVMETDTAGLDTVRHIREKLDNKFVRIILRTGQPGQAPEREVITEYDINDYKEKTELTAQKLFTCMVTAIRAYNDLMDMKALNASNQNLENRVRERTHEIMKINEALQQEVNERTRTLDRLQYSEKRLREAQKIARIGNWEWLVKDNVLNWSDQAQRIIGFKPEKPEDIFMDLVDLVVDEDKAMVKQAFDTALVSGEPYDTEHRIVRADGAFLYVHQQGQVEFDKNGRLLRIAGTVQDVTARRETEEKMRKLSGAVEQIADSVMITDQNGVIEYTNPAFEAMTGYKPEEVIGKTPRILRSERQSKAFYERMWKTILSGNVFSDIIINCKKNGEIYYEEKTITPQTDREGNIVHFISTGKDVTERIEAQERLQHLAHHDGLTGLPNRVLLQDRLEQAIARSRWHERKVAVMFIDLDRFKVINDTLGHDAGDMLLKNIADRLCDCIREGDTVARLGGDEFAIVLNDIASQQDVVPIAEKILTALKEPVELFGRELFVTVSIGISMFPRDGNTSHELLKKADVAMYRAKSQGKDNFQLFNDEDESQAIERLSMETHLRRALDRNEFSLHYQPQISMDDKSIIGVEALLRWQNPELENVSPAQFIPILEETGMINEVGDWVISEVCQQQKRWQDEGVPVHRVAINLSIRQLQKPGLVKRVETILAETGVDPALIELEVTEGLLIERISETAKILNEFHEMGLRLSIDDFGTGYSSMNYLKRLPFDTLKIDRIFVRDVTVNQDDAAIAAAIISLGHTMGMEVIAEGVETSEQLDYLKQHDCDAIQGYFYSPPVPADDYAKLANKGRFD